MSPWLDAYRGLTAALEPLAGPMLRLRARRGKEDLARIDERLGRPTAVRPAGPLVWLHGVSVGESLSALPLIQRLRRERPDLTVLVTSGTVTAASLLARRLPPGVIHQYAPIDAPAAADRFLDHWRPDLMILVESELWPNLVRGARDRGVRLALVSARITEKTAAGWGRLPGAARALLSAFHLVAPQDDASAARLAVLGAPSDLRVNLKLVGEPLPHDPGEFDRLSAAVGERAVIVGASTHPGEELLLAHALAGPGRLLVLVPRHPDRSGAIQRELAGLGRTVAVRSRGEPLAPDVEIYLADTLGELGLFLRLAEVVVMGGSLTGGVGGHNPLEPARLGKPAVSGPDVANWASVYEMLAAADAVRLVAGADDLAAAVEALLADPEAARALGWRAERAARRADDTLDRLWTALRPLLPA